MITTKMAMRGLALAALTMLVAACGTTNPGYQAPVMSPELQARRQAVAPMANLETRNLTYVGTLPPTIAPVSDNRVDELGDPQFLDTASAVARFGEPRIRNHVVRNVRLCARVELARIANGELRIQNEAAREHQRQVREGRNVTNGLAYGGMLGGAIQAWSSFGSDYGLTYVLGNLLPGAANQYTYGRVLEQNDLLVALSMANNDLWYNNNDMWLDAMDQWCPAFIAWVDQNGEIVPIGSTTTQP